MPDQGQRLKEMESVYSGGVPAASIAIQTLENVLKRYETLFRDDTVKSIFVFLVTFASACRGILDYKFFENPDSLFGLLFFLSGISLGILTNLWCVVWGFEIYEDEENACFDYYDPHEDLGVDPRNIYNTYDKG